MATLTATRAASTFPVAGGVGNAQAVKVAWGSYTVTANPAANDIIEFCRLPKGAVVVGGRFVGGALDASGGALDIDIGWANNGTDASDTDGFGNNGALLSHAVAGVKPESGVYNYPLGGVLLTAGPKTFAAETKIIGHVVASATTFATGTLTVMVEYYVP
jgi:hypothetical protein